MTVELCEFVPRGNLVNLNLKLNVPITNCLVNIQILYEKYKPFINNTWDGCELMASIKRRSVIYRLYDYIRPHSNLNHTCPFNGYIYLKNFTLTGKNVMLPMPNGDFSVKLRFGVDSKDRFRLDYIFNIKN
ncbi:uncharacterized protein LOC142225193 [Haematobia irritans]|uniref:uncharacterized protein LOC142225193 n=1 Tax=Haematobia irritans TaxID=7368 RepID=UPI003F5095AA